MTLQPGFFLGGRLMLSGFYMILGTMQVFNIHEVIPQVGSRA